MKTENKWISLPFAEYIENCGRSAPTSAGVLELFGFKFKAGWSDECLQEHLHDVFAAPVILEHANASDCYAAANDVFPAFSLSTITEICLVVKCLPFCEVPDAVGQISL